MFKIGCHLSSSKGYLAMAKVAVKIGANTFQYFTRNPRGGSIRALDLDDIYNYKVFAKENGIGNILAHAPYTLNPCAADEKILDFTRRAMKEDLERLENIPNAYYNFHPGSHVKQGASIGIHKISDMLNSVLKPGQSTMVLLETMSGKGSEIGRNFEELSQIISKVTHNELLGVCLDTCHVFDSGYDIVNNLEQVLDEFDRVIGLKRLRAVHLNDSMNALGSHKDRHQKIGEGSIGIDAMANIINHPILRELPFYLETPNDDKGHGEEIKLLKSMLKE